MAILVWSHPTRTPKPIQLVPKQLYGPKTGKSTNLDMAFHIFYESCDQDLATPSQKNPVSDGWRSVVLGQYRRFFSVLFVRVQAACLTSRMGHLGEGARDGAGISGSREEEGHDGPGGKGEERG